jgi:two-component sensor histidine kinase
VRIEQEAATIALTYRDDGSGYPQDVLGLERYNASLDIVRRIVRNNLRGSLILRNDGGAVTEIRFEKEIT